MRRSFFFVILFAILQLLAMYARASEERRVTVNGECFRMAIPDRGAISLVAEWTDPDLKDASKKAVDAYERTRNAVKKLNLDDLEMQTSEYNVDRMVDYEKGKSVFKGFRVRMGLRVSTSSVKRLGDVIAIAAREGLQSVGSLSMYLSQEKAVSEHADCLKTAAENARAKAEKLAGALGATVGPVVSVSESSETGPIHPMLGESVRVMKTTDVEAPSVEAGKQSINVAVTAVFSLK